MKWNMKLLSHCIYFEWFAWPIWVSVALLVHVMFYWSTVSISLFLLSGILLNLLWFDDLNGRPLHSAGVYKPAELWQAKEHQPPPKKRSCTMVFTLKEMEEATNMFSDRNLVGKGGFGRVYRGVLKDGQVLACLLFTILLSLSLSCRRGLILRRTLTYLFG